VNMKVVDLEHRKGEPLPFRVTLDPDDLKHRHQEVRGLSPVEASGEAAKLGNLYYVKGEMSADVNFVCARCLKPFTQHMAVPFAETFAPADAEELADEENDILLLTGDEIELDPLLEEHFLLAVPLFPLCEEDCQGLCPTCGANRNEQMCSCRNERIDPRLAGLADFFNRTE
jgi:uncharacterized protein